MNKLLLALIFLTGCATSQPTPFDGRSVIWTTNPDGTTTVSTGPQMHNTCMMFRMGRPVQARLDWDGNFRCFETDLKLAP